MDKVYLFEQGFNFNDIDGSYRELRVRKINETLLNYEPNDNERARLYYYKLLAIQF